MQTDLRDAKSNQGPATGGHGGAKKGNSFAMAASQKRSSLSSAATSAALMRRSTLANQPRVDASKWLADDFEGVKLKNFDEMRENFIEDLTNQFSDLLVPNTRHMSMQLPKSGNPLMESTSGERPATGAGDRDQEMEDVEERKGSPRSPGVNEDEPIDEEPPSDSDEEDASIIPDEKPEGGNMMEDSQIELDLTK